MSRVEKTLCTKCGYSELGEPGFTICPNCDGEGMSRSEEMPVWEMAQWALEHIDQELGACIKEATHAENVIAKMSEHNIFKKRYVEIAKANREREAELRIKKRLIMIAEKASREGRE